MTHRINMSCGQTDLYPECLVELGVQLGGPLYYPPTRSRIGTMGFVARPEYVLTTISALERSLRTMGHEVPSGAGISAANQVFVQGE